MTELFQQSLLFHISEASQVAAARRGCSDMAYRLGFDDTQAGRIAIIATEAATNILKHGERGDIIIRAVRHEQRNGIELLAIDEGEGMNNVDASRLDGVSTAGSPGTGLGAMSRLSAEFDVYSHPGQGTAIYSLVWQNDEKAKPTMFRIGAICLPLPSEEISGDAWVYSSNVDSISLMVADGLGHGPHARDASQPAIDLLTTPDTPPQLLLQQAHRALRGTRGAAVAVAQLDIAPPQIKFAGVGNIAAHLLSEGDRRQIMSHNGIVGNNMRHVQEFTLDWSNNSILVMHSDGLTAQWDIAKYPGLAHRHPSLIAAILYRDFSRKRDDATVVVLKQNF